MTTDEMRHPWDLTPAQLAWARAHFESLWRQRDAILMAYQQPYCVLVNPDRAPKGVVEEGSKILGLPIVASDVEEPTVAIREATSLS